MTATTSHGIPAAILMRDVERRFGSAVAIAGVSFTTPIGSLCGLVGPNGAGKTTTMRIIATELTPTKGRVEILGHPLTDATKAIRPRLGYMPDSAGLYEELTLEEYLGFFAAFYGLPTSRRKPAADTAMELAGVTRFAKRRLTGLSKGERQRVMLARTLIHDPQLLILDEPADGLDPEGRVELRELLLLLHERGKTILISSHILADLEMIATHVVLIRDGRVVWSGSRDRLLTGARSTIRIECLGGIGKAEARLGGRPDVAVLDSEDEALVVEAPGEPEVAAAMLRDLVLADVPVTSFARRVETLEEAYLRLAAPTQEGAA